MPAKSKAAAPSSAAIGFEAKLWLWFIGENAADGTGRVAAELAFALALAA